MLPACLILLKPVIRFWLSDCWILLYQRLDRYIKRGKVSKWERERCRKQILFTWKLDYNLRHNYQIYGKQISCIFYNNGAYPRCMMSSIR